VARRDDEHSASFWRDRANEAWARVEEMVSDEGKRWMTEIARMYDWLADEAAKRETAAKDKRGDSDRG
jgi:hypothetical protein